MIVSSSFAQEAEVRSRVFLLRDPSLVSRFRVHQPQLNHAWDRLLQAMFEVSTPTSAWSKLVKPTDTVALHLGGTAHPLSSIPQSLILHLMDQIHQAGVPKENILAWGQHQDRLIASGYDPQAVAFPLQSVIPGDGFDKDVFYFNEVVGRLIWGDLEFKPRVPNPQITEEESTDALSDQISNRSFFARVVTQRATKIINLAPMMDHVDLGIWGASASLALSSVDNSRRFFNDQQRGDPAIGEILQHDVLKKKVILHVMVGMVAQYAGGPEFKPYYTEPDGWLAVSTDPVALDSLALRQMERWRERQKIVPIGDKAQHLLGAQRVGAGVSDLKRVDVVQVSVK